MLERRRVAAMLVCLFFMLSCLLPISAVAQMEPPAEEPGASAEISAPEAETVPPTEEMENVAPPEGEEELVDPPTEEEDALVPPGEEESLDPPTEAPEPGAPPAEEPEDLTPPTEELLLMPLSLLLAEEPAPKTEVWMARAITPRLLLLPQGGDVKSLVMPTDIVAVVRPFGTVPGVKLAWDYNGFDGTKTGRQMIRCEVILPEGYAYYEDDEEAPLYVEQPVWVYSDDMTERETLYVINGALKASPSFPPIPLGADDAALTPLFASYCRDQISLETEDGLFLLCDYHYDLDLIDTGEAGYYAPFVPELPPGLILDEAEQKRTGMTVLVVDPDRVDLTGMRIEEFKAYSVYGKWLYKVESPQLFVSETSPLGEDAAPIWQEFPVFDAPPHYSIKLEDAEIYARLDPQSLRFSFNSVPEVATYWFQIRYEGGESNILQVDIDHGVMSATPSTGDRFGDRDGNETPPDDPAPKPSGNGGDRRPNPPPALVSPEETATPVQDDPEEPDETNPPAPPDIPDETLTTNGSVMPPSEPVSAVAVAMPPAPPRQSPPIQAAAEEDSAAAVFDGVSVTGAHLRAMLAAKPEQVPFRQGDVEVWLPNEALAALALRDDDVLAVHMDYQPLESLTILLTVNEAQIPLGAAFAAAIPWDGAAVQCYDEADEPVASAYDESEGVLRLTLTQPGTVHFLLPEPVESSAALPAMPHEARENAQGSDGDFLPYAAGLLGVSGMGGAALWLRKKRVKR